MKSPGLQFFAVIHRRGQGGEVGEGGGGGGSFWGTALFIM